MWDRGLEHPIKLGMDLCRDDVLWLALGIASIGLGTNLEDILHERHVLMDQSIALYGSGRVSHIPQSGAQAGTS